MNNAVIKLGDRVRVLGTSEEGEVIAPPIFSTWVRYHGRKRSHIPVFSIELDSGEVRFYVARAFEIVSRY